MSRRLRRAERRHHYRRLQDKRKGYWGHPTTKPIIWWEGHVDELMDEAQLGMVANTPQPCSCFSCGNPRRYFKLQVDRLTKQELIALQDSLDGPWDNWNGNGTWPEPEVETMEEAFCWADDDCGKPNLFLGRLK